MASVKESPATSEHSVTVETTEEGALISLTCPNRAGLLSRLTSAFEALGLDVTKADIGGDARHAHDRFWVAKPGGGAVTPAEAASIKLTLEGSVAGAGAPAAPPPAAKTRPLLAVPGAARDQAHLLHTLMDTYTSDNVLAIQQAIVHHVEYTLAQTRYKFDDLEAYMATAYSIRDRLIESWNDTQSYFKEVDPKRVYYLSMEFLMGRSLLNALNNLEVRGQYTEALAELGYSLETLVTQERDAALGNGGLGRLAACFLDSMATTNLPAWGYGIRYQYGMFRQVLRDGFQHEQPDYWLNFGNPWELERSASIAYQVSFYGHVSVQDDGGRQAFRWNPGEQVTAVAYDTPIPGFQTNNTNNLRLWAAKPDREFDLQAFNTGDYVQAILAKQRAETLSSVLYPDDRTYEGKELRLKQQHFFVSATVQDVVRRYREQHASWDAFPDKVAFQMNDTHPTLLVPELMRVLMDHEGLGWTRAWELVTETCNFTNHTILPEALERWPVAMMEKLLPRHMQIIYDINWRFLQQMRGRYGDDWDRISRMSIIEETPDADKYVRMAYLAVIAARTVNGVAAIHSNILRDDTFAPFHELFPGKFQNKTNGVTPRRWLAFCNEPLRELLTDTLGSDAWIKDLDRLKVLREHARDPALQKRWQEVKALAKDKALSTIERLSGVALPNREAMLDVQVKRIHEYKRQLLNVLGIVHRYDTIRKLPRAERGGVVPRVCVIGGKAAPGYEMAKRIIKLVSAVAEKVNNDLEVGDLLKVAFVPDYNVSVAEAIIPGTELSEHISTAGTEASGTGNMKFAMNGALIIGTMDGANIEIAEEIGEDNIFIFGARASEVAGLRAARAEFQANLLQPDPRFLHTLDLIRSGTFGWEDYFVPLLDSITYSDYYLVANDFGPYIEAQERVDRVYQKPEEWTAMSINSTAGSGFFSSDRTILEYAKDIWGVEPTPVPNQRDDFDD
ncbi:Glycogen phosphorylase 1 [Auxenochlorella protothecoides]|uniref:Alpha-1,4 glucan phosphorylase n=1 Tax=Auxenochlorella protothecoides TaxID=3075 RepID=A0A087SS36_AUXPR|nr:Glycogen phosphorylase 1 [Auxenochlorella protothecoides]KFM28540.1 Glycogen phosphorylase 1 [Auxenochlorella protothecoides]